MVSLNQHFYIFTYSHIYKPHVLKNLSKMNIARGSVLFIYDLFRVNRVYSIMAGITVDFEVATVVYFILPLTHLFIFHLRHVFDQLTELINTIASGSIIRLMSR